MHSYLKDNIARKKTKGTKKYPITCKIKLKIPKVQSFRDIVKENEIFLN